MSDDPPVTGAIAPLRPGSSTSNRTSSPWRDPGLREGWLLTPSDERRHLARGPEPGIGVSVARAVCDRDSREV
jgi:hypothetical protein